MKLVLADSKSFLCFFPHLRITLIFLLLFCVSNFQPRLVFGAQERATLDEIFSSGYKELESGNITRANQIWGKLGSDELLRPITYILSARAFLERGAYDDVELSIRDFQKSYATSPYRDTAKEILSKSLYFRKKPEALLLLSEKLNRASEKEKPEIIIQLAELEKSMARYDEALKHYRELYINYPASVEGLKASDAISWLVFNGKAAKPEFSENEKLNRADKLFIRGRFDLAAQEYEALLKQKPDNHSLLIKLARSKYKDRQNHKALSILQGLKSAQLSESDRAESLYLESLLYWRLDRDKEFENTCNALVTKAPQKYKKKVLFNLAGHALEKKKYSEAEKHFKKLLTMDPDPATKSDIKWKMAWIRYWEHNYAGAASLFKEARAASPGNKLEQASKYWQARSHLSSNKPKDAEILLKEIIENNPLDYYATESARLLRTMAVKDLPKPKTTAFPAVDIPKELSAVPAVVTALQLYDRHLYEFALINLDTLQKNVRNSPAIAFLTAKALYKSGKYSQAQETLIAAFGNGLVENPPESAPREFIEIAYPRIHMNETIKTSQKHSVDPHLVWAIIRQESRYDATAVSPAGALGLMQVMPGTVAALKRQQQVKNTEIEEILEPTKNLGYGIRILASNLNAFQGKLIPAIASYNADIVKVKDWVRRNNKMKPDEFIESIPYLETRLYVKKVLAGYRAYSKLHKQKDLVGLW